MAPRQLAGRPPPPPACRDKHRGFQLYQSDPSGNFGGWKATAIGANHQAATNVLQGDFPEEGGLSLEEVRGARCGCEGVPVRGWQMGRGMARQGRSGRVIALVGSIADWRRAGGQRPCATTLLSTVPMHHPPTHLHNLRALRQAMKLVIKVLSKTMDSTTLSPEKVELATLSRDEAAGKVQLRQGGLAVTGCCAAMAVTATSWQAHALCWLAAGDVVRPRGRPYTSSRTPATLLRPRWCTRCTRMRSSSPSWTR